MNNLRKIRQEKGLRIVDVAIAGHVSMTTVTLIEAGYDRAKKSTKIRLAKALDCNIKDIFPE